MSNQQSTPPRSAGPSQFSGALFAVALLGVLAAGAWWQNQQAKDNSDSRRETSSTATDESRRPGARLPDEHEPTLPHVSPDVEETSEEVRQRKNAPAPDPSLAAESNKTRQASPQVADHSDSKPSDNSSTSDTDKDLYKVPHQTIRDLNGKVAYKGTIDLQPTLDRIERGEVNRHHNDGTTFQNREGRLPKKAAGYYKEYVHPTPGVSGPGPQRIILGREHEIWYTPDHYKTFLEIPLPRKSQGSKDR